MPVVYTMEGAGGKPRRARGPSEASAADGVGCRRVRHGKKPGCTIALCPGKSKHGKHVMKFKKGSVRCA